MQPNRKSQIIHFKNRWGWRGGGGTTERLYLNNNFKKRDKYF